MKTPLIALTLSLLAAGLAQAQTAAEKKDLAARYQSDLKVCSSEADAADRMQCKRDAKAEYDKALAAAAAKAKSAALPAASASTSTSASASASAQLAPCADCGRVVAVTQVERQGEASPVGMLAGGVVGGLLGHQVGGGSGKDLATLAGAAGGAYAGREVEKRVNKKLVWEVKVDFGAGGTHSYDFAQDPGLKAGDRVKKSGNTVVRP